MADITQDFENVLDRLKWAKDIVGEILEGRKPEIDPADPGQKWLYDQVARMNAGFFVPDEAKCYFTLPRETDKEISLKGQTDNHPFHYAYLSQMRELEQRFEKADFNNYKVLGADIGYRDAGVNPSSQNGDADSFVLTKGDFFSLYQGLSLLQEKLEPRGSERDVENLPRLVIQNTDDFWDPVIKGLGLDEHEQQLKSLGVCQTGSVHDTLECLENLGRKKSKPAKFHGRDLTIEPGSTILIATGNSKKIRELRRIMQAQKAKVNVLSFNMIAGKPREAKELAHSYVGNNIEKLGNAIERLEGQSRETIERRLRARGADPAKTYILVDDRGIETLEDFMSASAFDCCRDKLNPYKRGPGVELAHVMKSMSTRELYGAIEDASKNLAMQKRAKGELPDIDLTVYDICSFVLTELYPEKGKDRRVLTTIGATEDHLVFTPSPNVRHVYSEHFQKPKWDQQGRTKAEIPGFIENHSAQALAGRALSYLTGMDEHKFTNGMHNRAAGNLNKAAHRKRRRINIGTLTSLYSNVRGHGIPGVGRKLNGSFNLVSGASGTYDLNRMRTFPYKTSDGNVRISHSALGNYETLLKDIDGVLFTPPPKALAGEDKIADRGFAFFSAFVGNQVFNPYTYGKFFGVFKDGWEDMLSLVDHYHELGLIGDQPHDIYQIVESKADAQEKLKAFEKNYVPVDAEQPQFTEMGKRQTDGLFRVTVYCSATSTNNKLKKQAFDFAYNLAKNGFALKNGGGEEGLMSETSNGVHAFRKDFCENGQGKMPRNHVESIQCDDTEQSEGLREDNDYACTYPNIFQRMDDLQNCEAEVVLAGGGGTLQEVFASMKTRLDGLRPVENRPLIIVNQTMGEGKYEQKIYDKLLDCIPSKLMAKCNIKVVDTIYEALDLCIHARQSIGMQPQYTDIDGGMVKKMNGTNGTSFHIS